MLNNKVATMNNLKTLLTICFALSATLVVAQGRHYTTSSLGMGGGGTAYVDGYHANFINPANLMLQTHRPKRSLGLLGGVGARVGGSLVNISTYNKYLTKGLTIDGQTRVDMLNDFFGSNPENTRELSGTLNIVPFGFSNRGTKSAFSLSSRVRVTEDLAVNKGLAELGFYGLDSEKFGTPTPVNFDLNVVSFAEVSIGYAREVFKFDNLLFARNVKIYAGVAPKYIIGAQSSKMDFNSTITVSGTDGTNQGSVVHNFNYSIHSFGELSQQLQDYSGARSLNSKAKFDDYVDYSGSDVGTLGSGFGLDMGVTAEMDISHISIPVLNFFGKDKKLRVSMSLTDLGKVSFDENPSRIYADGTFTFDGDIGETEIGDYYDNLQDSLQNDIYGNFDAEKTGAVDYRLPGMYNFGAALTAGKLMLAIDYGFGFNNNGTNSKKSSLNLGVEYRLLGFMPLRVGTRMGGFASTAYTGGFGLDFNFFELTVAGSIVNDSKENGGSATGVWSGLVFRF
tara:strand:- start:465 stop:1991 length:1527 start_codon:yes stop_codon:yes gene_type:complete